MKLTFKHAVATIILVLSFGAPLSAGPSEDAAAAYAKQDYATALRLWRSLASKGDAAAQNNLGSAYAFGRGVPQDNAEAALWL